MLFRFDSANCFGQWLSADSDASYAELQAATEGICESFQGLLQSKLGPGVGYISVSTSDVRAPLSKMSTLFSRNVANKSATRGTSIRAGPGLGSDTNVFKEWETCAQELDGNMTNYSAVTKINKIVDGALESFMFIDVITLPSRSLTCYFKMTVSKRNLLFQNAIFRLHVKLWEGNPRSKKHKGAIRFRFFFPPPLPTRYSRHEK